MKYYVYISDAKVNMLLSQIPHDVKHKIAQELGIDIKIFKAMRKVESEYEEDRVSKLETVANYIREWGNLGTVQKSDIYIEDTLDMHFRIITIPGDRAGDSPRTAAYWTDLMEFLYHGV